MVLAVCNSPGVGEPYSVKPDLIPTPHDISSYGKQCKRLITSNDLSTLPGAAKLCD